MPFQSDLSILAEIPALWLAGGAVGVSGARSQTTAPAGGGRDSCPARLVTLSTPPWSAEIPPADPAIRRHSAR